MNCPVSNQIAEHANSDCQACAEAEKNETALNDLFEEWQGDFSHRTIYIEDVFDESLRLDSSEFIGKINAITEIENNTPETWQEARIFMSKQKAAKACFRNHLKAVALGMNEAMCD